MSEEPVSILGKEDYGPGKALHVFSHRSGKTEMRLYQKLGYDKYEPKKVMVYLAWRAGYSGKQIEEVFGVKRSTALDWANKIFNDLKG